MQRDSFIMYTEYKPQIEMLTMEQRGILLTAIMNFESGEELPELDPITQMAFSFMQSRLERDYKKWLDICEKRSEYGKKGGRPKKTNVENEKQTKAKKAYGFSEKQMVFSEKQTKAKKADNDIEPDYEPDYDTDIDTESENNSDTTKVVSCTEQSNETITDYIVTDYSLPLNNGKYYTPDDSKITDWMNVFQCVDILQEFKKMRLWLDDNTQKRKTQRGINRFVSSWLGRCQDNKPKQSRDVETYNKPSSTAKTINLLQEWMEGQVNE